MYSQNTSGRVIYEATPFWKVKEINLDDVDTPANVKLMYNKLINNKNKLKYILKFNKNKSLFKKDENLDLEGKKNIILKGHIENGNFYYDKKNSFLLNEKDSHGEIFLISYPKTQWKITNETKKINGYLCGKAITTKVENSLLRLTSEITAWFAFDLPYNYGPKQFTGLPGLILELEYTGKYKMRATKIELNPKEKIKIELPNKGIKMSLKKHEEMISKSFKQRQKSYKRRN
jgi:GLPGLI family protein